MIKKKLIIPTSLNELRKLKAGDFLLISGTLFTARDETHQKMKELKEKGLNIPVDLKNQILYYVGPAPSRPGQVINSAGPTSARRMDSYTDLVLDLGVIGMIGKGERSEETREKMKGKAVYMAAFGGVAAKLARCIKSQEIVAFPELGMGAVRKLELVDFPVIVINDLEANDYYEETRSQFPNSSG